MGSDVPGVPEELLQIASSLEDLKPYLLSEALYGNVGISDKQRLTPGNLLLWIRNASALSDQPKLIQELQKLTNQFELVRTRWLSSWQKKAAWEFKNRMDRWRDYLEEMVVGERSMPVYRYQVRHRVILELLSGEISTGIKDSSLDILDDRLGRHSRQDSFIWDPKLEREYPLDTYWYLYRKLDPE